MAYFARLGTGNIVERIHIVHNNIMLDENEKENEQKGIDFLQNMWKTNAIFVQTSYNTFAGIHSLGGTSLRKNYAGRGYKYDAARDAFIPPKKYQAWLLDENTCRWKPPIPLLGSYTIIPLNYKWSDQRWNDGEEDKLGWLKFNTDTQTWEDVV
jgi:hypothetical protein